VGDPAECRDKLSKYAEAGVTHLLLAFGAGALEGAVVRESLELFAREVMPALSPGDSESGRADSNRNLVS